MGRLKAEEAKLIAQSKDPALAVDTILEKVREHAEAGRYSLIVRDYGFSTGECYTSEDKYPPLCRGIVNELRQLGYEASVVSNDGSIAVDMYLRVSWT